MRVPLAEFEPALKKRLEALWGTPPNLYCALANHPGILEGFMGFSGAAYWGSSVAPPLRELAYLTASSENSCHY